MLFNSYPFLFGFLPLALIGYQIAAHWHRRAVVAWLALISLVFYGYWKPAFLILLCSSVVVNYVAGALISRPTMFLPESCCGPRLRSTWQRSAISSTSFLRSTA